MVDARALGRLAGGLHVMALRIYWEDTDASGIVYYANYLRFMERARSDLVRLAGINQRALMDEQGFALAVRSCSLEYLSPARLDDDVEVHSKLTALRGASIDIEQVVMRDGAELVRGRIRIVCIDLQGRACRIPETVRQALSILPVSPVEGHHG